MMHQKSMERNSFESDRVNSTDKLFVLNRMWSHYLSIFIVFYYSD